MTYQSVFGGDSCSTRSALQRRQGQADKCLPRGLDPCGFTLMASDTPEGWSAGPGHNVSTSALSGYAPMASTSYSPRLAEGAPSPCPWRSRSGGDVFGMCVDKFPGSPGWSTSRRRPLGPDP